MPVIHRVRAEQGFYLFPPVQVHGPLVQRFQQTGGDGGLERCMAFVHPGFDSVTQVCFLLRGKTIVVVHDAMAQVTAKQDLEICAPCADGMLIDRLQRFDLRHARDEFVGLHRVDTCSSVASAWLRNAETVVDDGWHRWFSEGGLAQVLGSPLRKYTRPSKLLKSTRSFV